MGLVGLPAVLLVASPASAASPTTVAELQSDLGGCTGTTASPYVETLSQDLSDTAAPITVGCVAVLDLRSFDLTVRDAVISSGQQLTVRDTSVAADGVLTADASDGQNVAGIGTTGSTLVVTSGVVHATGGDGAAGIGGAVLQDGGTVRVDGGSVTASGESAAGIGSGLQDASGAGGSAGSLTVSGGTVNASSDFYGAGVGGGADGNGGTVTVSGGSLIATGGNHGAGIGSGADSNGPSQSGAGSLTVSGGSVVATGGASSAGVGGGGSYSHKPQDGATVTVTAGTLTAVGDGETAVGGSGPGGAFGTLDVHGTGTLRLPQGVLAVDDSVVGPEIVVGTGGLITGSSAVSPTYATISGAGQIQNDGVIDMPTANVTGGGVTVSDRHYDVTFDAAGGSPTPDPVTVYADSFTSGDRGFPAGPSKPGFTFTQWETTGGTHVTADTDLEIFGKATGTAAKDALPIGLVAQYTLDTPDSSLPALQAGLSTCTGTTQAPYVVTLTQDLTDPTAELTVNCVAVIDLDSHDLTVRDVVIGAGDGLTVRDSSAGAGGVLTADASPSAVAGIGTTDATSALAVESGTVTALGGGDAAGIGGDVTHPGGVTTVSGGTVHATGGAEGAGIGSGDRNGLAPLAAGSLTVSGGTVTATGGLGAAGVGSGRYDNSPTTVSVTGGTLTATGGQYGAGVGGGEQGSGGKVTVSGGTLLASGNGNAVGAGTDGTAFGSLVVTGGGVVRITGNEFVLDSDPSGPEIALAGGFLTGSADATPSYATISGAGQIQNAGVIDMPEADVSEGGVTVSDRHYDLTFAVAAGTSAAPDPVTVYADSFADGLRTFPADPTPPTGQVFTGWVGFDQSSDQALVTAGTNLLIFGTANGTTASDGVPITLTATFRPLPTVTGTDLVGRLLTAHQAVPGPPSPTITYTWVRTKGNTSTAIAGATAKTYRLTTADDGARIRVLTNVTQDDRRSSTLISAFTSKVDLPTLRAPLAPQIKFPTDLHPHVGRSLVAALAHTIPGQGSVKNLVHHFQWYAGTTPVGGDRPSLTITPRMKGKRLSVRVTYSATGYHPVSVTSRPTRTVVLAG